MFWPFDRLFPRSTGNPRHPESLAFDERWGTETAAFDPYNYEPSLPSVLEGILDRVPAAGRTFLDLGSGKGRAVFQAAQRPFVSVVGLERDYELHLVAIRNFQEFSSRTTGLAPVYLQHGDAQQHPLPDGELVVYLYNPFSGPVMKRVAQRLARPGVLLVYLNPFEAASLEGWVEVDSGGEAPWAWRMFRFA